MSAEAAVSSPDPTMPPPTLPFVTADRSISRPLSEITDNSDKRRSTARSLKGDKGEKTSRPNSEVRDSEPAKRLSSTISLQTITVNLVDYAAVVAKGPTSISSSASAASSLASPIIKPVPVRAEKPSIDGICQGGEGEGGRSGQEGGGEGRRGEVSSPACLLANPD